MEAQAEPKKTEIKENLTPEYAARFLFQSFRHSQGNKDLQKKIFCYTHLKKPEWKISPQDQPKIRELTRQSITNFLGVESKKGIALHPYPLKDLEHTLDEELLEMEMAFAGIEEGHYGNIDDLIQSSAINIIQRDIHYLQKEDGRQRTPESSEKPVMDPWLSYIIHFAFNRNPTGIAELDEMYRDIRVFVLPFILSGNTSDEIRKLLDDVIKIYREKHPRTPIDLNP